MKKVFAFLVLLGLVLFVLFYSRESLVPVHRIYRPDCLYPDRTTNTETVCDNSDPCDPQSAVKGGSGECSTAEIEKAVSYNIIEVENPVESVGK